MANIYFQPAVSLIRRNLSGDPGGTDGTTNISIASTSGYDWFIILYRTAGTNHINPLTAPILTSGTLPYANIYRLRNSPEEYAIGSSTDTTGFWFTTPSPVRKLYASVLGSSPTQRLGFYFGSSYGTPVSSMNVTFNSVSGGDATITGMSILASVTGRYIPIATSTFTRSRANAMTFTIPGEICSYPLY